VGCWLVVGVVVWYVVVRFGCVNPVVSVDVWVGAALACCVWLLLFCCWFRVCGVLLGIELIACVSWLLIYVLCTCCILRFWVSCRKRWVIERAMIQRVQMLGVAVDVVVVCGCVYSRCRGKTLQCMRWMSIGLDLKWQDQNRVWLKERIEKMQMTESHVLLLGVWAWGSGKGQIRYWWKGEGGEGEKDGWWCCWLMLPDDGDPSSFTNSLMSTK